MAKRVFVAMSGGVDSSVAAALLKERDFDVRGIFMKNWAPPAPSAAAQGGSSGHADPRCPCPWVEDRRDAMRVAAHLGIPFRTWDFTAEYRRAVVDAMIREYAAGRTPNPDVECNREIKFGLFLQKALAEGADFVATGHYVRTIDSPAGKKLLAATDTKKDQSYFLWTLGRRELGRCLFPIGVYRKPEVRSLARQFGLPTADKPDSQGICFMGEIDLAAFLREHIPERRGLVMTTAGRVVGEHRGVEFFTIGQRHGLAIGGRPVAPGEPRPNEAGGIPYYVVEKRRDTNTLVVATGPYDEHLFGTELIANEPRWVSGAAPPFPLRCYARIRYRQPLQRCEVTKSLAAGHAPNDPVANDSLLVRFAEPQRAITPGQSVVFYQGEELLGGGVIA